MRLIEALARGSICCMLAAGCRMGYEDAATLRHATGNTAGSGASTSGATGGGSGAAGTVQPAGAGDPGMPPGAGGDGTSTGGGTDGSAGGASGDTGTQGNGGTTASGGMGGSAAASDAGGAAGDALGGSGATGGTSVSGGAGGTTATGGSSGLGGGGYAGASSLGDCMSATYGGRDYLFCNVKVIWEQARDNCASIGMVLARVDDAGEDQFLSDNAYATPPITGIWLGASDALVEGEWRWLDGELFWLGAKTGSAQNSLYNGWYVLTQPSAQQPERDCAVHNLGNSPGWYDADCTFSKEYVCEPL